jgi:hypothetical protein
MTPLNYQRPEDYREEHRRARRRAFLGTHHAAAFEAFARETGAAYVRGPLSTMLGKIITQIGPWTLTLKTHSGDSAHIMRLDTSLRLACDFRFHIRPFGFFDQLGEFIRLRRLNTGEKRFDANFISRTNRPDLLQQILQRDSIRSLYRSFFDATFSIRPSFSSRFRRGQPSSATLLLVCQGLNSEASYLARMHNLFGQTLPALVDFGIATA